MNMTHYELLGVQTTATRDEIKKAYRLNIRRYHPDSNDAPNADFMFRIVKEAYEILIDDDKRREYDNSLSNEEKQGEDARHKAEEMYNESTYSRNPNYRYTDHGLHEELKRHTEEMLNEYKQRPVILSVILIIVKIAVFPIALVLQGLSLALAFAGAIIGGIAAALAGLIVILLVGGTLIFELDNLGWHLFWQARYELLMVGGLGIVSALAIFAPAFLATICGFLWAWIFPGSQEE